MYDRFSLLIGRVMTFDLADLKRQEGQGATEYAMVIGFLVVGLTLTIGLLGDSIEGFLDKVGDKLEALVP
jgi:Flp pilus assembly pilin Flp